MLSPLWLIKPLQREKANKENVENFNSRDFLPVFLCVIKMKKRIKKSVPCLLNCLLKTKRKLHCSLSRSTSWTSYESWDSVDAWKGFW